MRTHVGASTHFQNDKLEIEHLSRCLDRPNLGRSRGRIPKNGDARDFWNGFFQRLQPFLAEFGKIEKHTGNITAGPGVAG